MASMVDLPLVKPDCWGLHATPMSALKKIGQSVDLHRKIKFATWHVMTLSGTSYQVALVHELARFNLSVAGITEARHPAVASTPSRMPYYFTQEVTIT